jgi:hypothetical protein
MIARIAALVTAGAPTASYLANLAGAEAAELDPEQIRGVLAAVAPIAGTTRVVEAAGNITEAFGIVILAALEAAELEAEADE